MSVNELIQQCRDVAAQFGGLETPQGSGLRQAWDSFQAGSAGEKALEKVEEYRFTLAAHWSQMLFIALLRKYGVHPYRYRGQKRTTVMARLSKRFVDETLWPQYQELSKIFEMHFHTLAYQVISEAVAAGPYQIEIQRRRPGSGEEAVWPERAREQAGRSGDEGKENNG